MNENEKINPYPCEKCELWNRAAIDNGYQSGMCEECYDKYYVTFKGNYEPKYVEIKGKNA